MAEPLLVKPLLGALIWLHNWSYRAISSLAVRLHGGLHPKHEILQYHRFFVDHVSLTDTVLDVGCGKGQVAWALAQKAKMVTGIDISAVSITQAKRRFAKPNLSFVTGDATTYQFGDSFDVIVLSNTLEHIGNRVALLTKLKKIAPVILIRVPLLTRDWLPVYKKQLGYEYRLDPTHYIEYTEELFNNEVAMAGLTVQQQSVRFGELYSVVERNNA